VSNMNKFYYIISLLFIIIVILVLKEVIIKEKIFISLVEIPGHEFSYNNTNPSETNKVIYRRLGKESYKYWEFELDTSKVKRIDLDKIIKNDIVSQYWILNNFNGFSIDFDIKEMKKYKLYFIRVENDGAWIYPVKKTLFIKI